MVANKEFRMVNFFKVVEARQSTNSINMRAGSLTMQDYYTEEVKRIYLYCLNSHNLCKYR
jgi:hypothetical protein